MRPLVFALCLLSVVACKKGRPPVGSAPPAKCTAANLTIADPERCEQDCFTGDAEACAVASSQFQAGIQTRRDPGRALSQAAKGCDLGSALCCANVAEVLSGRYDGRWPDGGVYRDDAQLELYEGKALAAADRGCAAGRFESCVLGAYRFDRPMAAARKPDEAKAAELAKRAVNLMETACAARDGFACAALASSTADGALGLSRNVERAAELHARACAEGHAESCRNAWPEVTEEERRRLLQRGCELGAGRACSDWAVELGGAAAEPVLRRACELRDGNACEHLARRLKGDEAQKLIERACALGFEQACAPD